MTKPKISIIGAGSARFSLTLIQDLCLTPNLAGSIVSLMDVDQARLDAAFIICQRYANEIGAELHLEKTVDRRESLQDADFVVNTALVAGHQMMMDGIQIASDLGYRYGGSYHIMHDEPFWVNYYQFKFFDELTEDMLEVCPESWHLLVANPVLAGTTHIHRKYPQAKMIGLCHGYANVYQIASVLGLEKEGLTFELPGLNHFIWLTQCHHNGEDIFPLLDRWIEEKSAEYWETSWTPGEINPNAVDLYRRFGAFPIGDTCTPGGGAWPWWYHTDNETEAYWKEDVAGYRQRVIEKMKATANWSQELAAKHSVKLTAEFPPEKSGWNMIPIIESMVCDIPRTFIVNLGNRGNFINGIPLDFEVEVPAVVSKSGVRGIHTQGLPVEILAHALQDRVAPVNVELEAYEQGSRELLRQLILMDPWTRSTQQANDLLSAILNMPHNYEMQHHYS
jgi:alpha-galactosidase